MKKLEAIQELVAQLKYLCLLGLRIGCMDIHLINPSFARVCKNLISKETNHVYFQWNLIVLTHNKEHECDFSIMMQKLSGDGQAHSELLDPFCNCPKRSCMYLVVILPYSITVGHVFNASDFRITDV